MTESEWMWSARRCCSLSPIIALLRSSARWLEAAGLSLAKLGEYPYPRDRINCVSNKECLKKLRKWCFPHDDCDHGFSADINER